MIPNVSSDASCAAFWINHPTAYTSEPVVQWALSASEDKQPWPAVIPEGVAPSGPVHHSTSCGVPSAPSSVWYRPIHSACPLGLCYRVHQPVTPPYLPWDPVNHLLCHCTLCDSFQAIFCPVLEERLIWGNSLLIC